jgi:arginyl-tRNA synthetase
VNLLELLRTQFTASLARLTDKPQDYAQHVRAAQDPRFGDYQANCAMPLKKELGGNPRDIAQRIIDGLPDRSLFAQLEIAGPGFINMRLSDAFVAARLAERVADERLGLVPPPRPTTMVIDFSSPNVAKPMHVGHLRSTIIGDALARMHRALGWKVHTDNHLGDWGTQFGMLIYGWRNFRDPGNALLSPIDELCRLYQKVNDLAENDPAIAQAARLETARLHENDPENLALWNTFMPWCLADLERIYQRLDIHFDHQFGESFYQPKLADTVAALRQRGLACTSDGAVCAFFPDPNGKTDAEGNPAFELPPMVIQKADGAFTYATSDLACIRYREETFKPDAIVYVVDDRQSLHFQQLFRLARRWGHEEVELVHVAFGKIMDKTGKPFKTREGGTVGLAHLLDEAIVRARKVVEQASREVPEEERQAIAEAVGIGAVKYADLCQNRTSDYVFDWDKMISLDGNTAAYLQYVYARNRSIFRKGEVDAAQLVAQAPAIRLDHPSERTLAVDLLRYPESVAQAAADFKPNLVTNYLYELANHYNDFFRDCPVLKAEPAELRQSRLALCELTARTIRHGLSLLGIRTVERM